MQDTTFAQNLRYKLQKRLRRLKSCDKNLFHPSLKQFYNYLRGDDFFVGLLNQLETQLENSDHISKEVEQIFNSGQGIVWETDLECAVAGSIMIRKCVENDDQHIEYSVGRFYGRTERDGANDIFIEVFVEPVYEYLDEKIDDSELIVANIVKYKERSEWFHRESLLETWSRDTKRGEKSLAKDLYGYLHDQGMALSIEPSSPSGIADLVAEQNGDHRMVADVKVFDGSSRGVSYLAKGFKQIITYVSEYTEPFGYLVIFKVSEEDLSFSLHGDIQKVPFIRYNNKIIYFIVIDICNYEETASNRGILKPVVVSVDRIIREMEN